MEKCCENCKYINGGSNICIKNHFRVDWLSHSVCDYFKENETVKIKRNCNFRVKNEKPFSE